MNARIFVIGLAMVTIGVTWMYGIPVGLIVAGGLLVWDAGRDQQKAGN